MPVARGKASWKFGVPRYRIATYRRYNAHFLFTTTLKSGVVQVWFWDLVYSSCARFFFLFPSCICLLFSQRMFCPTYLSF